MSKRYFLESDRWQEGGFGAIVEFTPNGKQYHYGIDQNAFNVLDLIESVSCIRSDQKEPEITKDFIDKSSFQIGYIETFGSLKKVNIIGIVKNSPFVKRALQEIEFDDEIIDKFKQRERKVNNIDEDIDPNEIKSNNHYQSKTNKKEKGDNKMKKSNFKIPGLANVGRKLDGIFGMSYFGGDIAVLLSDGFFTFDKKTKTLTNVNDFVMEMPIPGMIMPVQIQELKVGDILFNDGDLSFVTNISGGNVELVNGDGDIKKQNLIKNAFMPNVNYVEKVVNLFDGGLFGGNPTDGAQNGNPFGNMNPMMMMMFMGDDDDSGNSMKDMMMMSMMMGNGGLFGQAQQPNPTNLTGQNSTNFQYNTNFNDQ